MLRYVLDTETSGLLDDPDARVIEIGIAAFDTSVASDEPALRFSALLDPGYGASTTVGREVIRQVSQISLENSYLFPPGEIGLLFDRILGKGSEVGVCVVGWNLSFDLGMLARSELYPTGDPRPVLLDEPCNSSWPGCIKEAFERIVFALAGDKALHPSTGRPRWFSLDAAAELYEVAVELPRHRALSDAITAGRVLRRVQNGIREFQNLDEERQGHLDRWLQRHVYEWQLLMERPKNKIQRCPSQFVVNLTSVRCSYTAGHQGDGSTAFAFHKAEHTGHVWTDADALVPLDDVSPVSLPTSKEVQ